MWDIQITYGNVYYWSKVSYNLYPVTCSQYGALFYMIVKMLQLLYPNTVLNCFSLMYGAKYTEIWVSNTPVSKINTFCLLYFQIHRVPQSIPFFSPFFSFFLTITYTQLISPKPSQSQTSNNTLHLYNLLKIATKSSSVYNLSHIASVRTNTGMVLLMGHQHRSRLHDVINSHDNDLTWFG